MNAQLSQSYYKTLGPGDIGDIEGDRKAERDIWIEAEAIRLYEEDKQDLEALSDASDWANYKPEYVNDPQAIILFTLMRDGTDDCELGRLYRETTLRKLWARCEDAAVDLFDNPDEDVEP